MKSILKSKKESCNTWFPLNINLSIKSIILSAFIVLSIQSTLIAQTPEPMVKPSWWFGAAAGANFNFYRGTTHEMNGDFKPPVAFHDGFGVGLFAAPTIEFYKPNTIFGAMLQVGYDSRKAKFAQTLTPCDCPQDMKTKLSYVTIEPSLRIAPFKSNFYIFAGPRLAFNLKNSFVYQLQPNPDYVDQVAGPEIEGEYSDTKKMLVSMQVGAGYDLFLTKNTSKVQLVFSPFVSYHPYFGQNPRSIETWNISTIRTGAALKFGVSKKTPTKKDVTVTPVKTKPVVTPDVDFSVNSPENIPAKRTVRETFPVINYVFFDLGSTEIPKRYVMLKKNQVTEFKEENVQLFTPSNLSGRSDRQMVVYYNILNILGDRMVKNPDSNVKLVGSSELGVADGRAMAVSVQDYLVNVFAINPSRISIEGRNKPLIPSEKPGATLNLDLLRQGDRRVTIESTSPALLMEFQNGPDAPLKPVTIVAEQEAPVESYVTFENEGADEAFTSWSLEIKDKEGKVQYFGPYTQNVVAIPGKSILGNNHKGGYNVKMIGTTKEGKKIEKEAEVNMVLWTPSTTEEVMRFSVPFNFDESTSIAMYNKYLTEVVAPKIQKGAKVIIHGYTDEIGNAAYNQKLSAARANDVKNILQKALPSAIRNDVTFEVLGLGEDPKLSPFENNFPEERFYNRTVVIDIIPRK